MLPDVTSAENVKLLDAWDGSWVYLTTIPWIKVTNTGNVRKSEPTSKALNWKSLLSAISHTRKQSTAPKRAILRKSMGHPWRWLPVAWAQLIRIITSIGSCDSKRALPLCHGYSTITDPRPYAGPVGDWSIMMELCCLETGQEDQVCVQEYHIFINNVGPSI